MSLVLDAGALVAIERLDRDVIALLKQESVAGRVPRTHAGVVGQVWRGGSGRQAILARILPGLDVCALDEALGKRAGMLLGRARKTDVVDAAVVLLAEDGDTILTSDPQDLQALAACAGVHVDLVPP
ncbi:MAG: PIN domain nuclease [Deltaproteobacteria bacterium]|nr:PIN domain nuclease [Deltaproteobacteria bacterium]